MAAQRGTPSGETRLLSVEELVPRDVPAKRLRTLVYLFAPLRRETYSLFFQEEAPTEVLVKAPPHSGPHSL